MVSTADTLDSASAPPMEVTDIPAIMDTPITGTTTTSADYTEVTGINFKRNNCPSPAFSVLSIKSH